MAESQRYNLHIEKQKLTSVKREQKQILEQLPEGVLILNEKGELKFINEEFKVVLNINNEKNQQSGIDQQVFKRYNFQDAAIYDEIEQPVSIHTLIKDTNWKTEEERYFELQLFDSVTEEERIFAQIKKIDITYKAKPAIMLLVSNISHIIKFEKIKNQNKYQELLTGTMSHEMLTPLNSIINLTLFVEARLHKRYEAEVELSGERGNSAEHTSISQCLNYLNIIRSSGSILQFYVKDLIDLMNINNDKFCLNKEPFLTQDACQEIMSYFELQAKEKNIRLQLYVNPQFQSRIRKIVGDKQRYQQILLVLLGNGVKFTYRGEVNLILSFLQEQGEDQCQMCGQLITTVKDTGIGINNEIVEKLFQLFGTYADRRKHITTSGIGLGLSICKQLITKLGGEIKLETQPEIGTTISFTLPFKCEICLATQNIATFNSNITSQKLSYGQPDSIALDMITIRSNHSNFSKQTKTALLRLNTKLISNTALHSPKEFVSAKMKRSDMTNDNTNLLRALENISFKGMITRNIMSKHQNTGDIIRKQTQQVRSDEQSQDIGYYPYSGSANGTVRGENYNPEQEAQEHRSIMSGARSSKISSMMRFTDQEECSSRRKQTKFHQNFKGTFNHTHKNDLRYLSIKNLNNIEFSQSYDLEQTISNLMDHGETLKKTTGYFPSNKNLDPNEYRVEDEDDDNIQTSNIHEFLPLDQSEHETDDNNAKLNLNYLEEEKNNDRFVTVEEGENEEYKMRMTSDERDQSKIIYEVTNDDHLISNDNEEIKNCEVQPVSILDQNIQVDGHEQHLLFAQFRNQTSSLHSSPVLKGSNKRFRYSFTQNPKMMNMMDDDGEIIHNTNKRSCSCESTVLIVDDNMFNLIPLELILKEMFGINVDKALNGQEAVNMYTRNLLKKCCETKYKLILMDLNMPIMDGYEATLQIISQFKRVYPEGQYPSGDKMFVVAITAFVNDENIKNCYKVGMKEVLHKPVNIDSLRRVLDFYYHYKYPH